MKTFLEFLQQKDEAGETLIWVLAAGVVYITFILSLLWILANLDPNSYGYPSSYQPEVSQQLTAGEIN